ncbi:unnamed protein product (macronuclear) [Paramecium tetraurelia]|uniref:EF-hand domain-containing protein n=1 Tax=Paramecium tetraurelia TaxID=5888 RepID=A0E9E9_PARTE|nr:uncharacterized protein GSPATT00024647001 [Paramecium tetraurelia]CAK91916.1 unnamed protein product [Paramecium tetraurelia]|eukprot:XP_001459313.1 hypothetical protein (macronuclear) [Paramecium tetraurelia strain d4-2]
MQILPPAERVLHYCESKNWFNSRHASKTKEQYLKTEKELFDDVIVTETFHLIDRDHSNSIELDELYSMLKKNKYPVNMSLLKAFFDKTDKDGNKCIDLDEFKQVIKDESTSQTFRMMMRRMREIGDDNYYSTDFVNLLRYLSYCSNRTDLIFQIKNARISFEMRSKLVSDLLKVNQQFTKPQNPTQDQLFTLRPFMKKKTQLEFKYLTSIQKRPNLLSNHSTTTSNHNSIISLKAINFQQHSPRLTSGRFLIKKKQATLMTTPFQSTKSTLQSTQTTLRKNYIQF